MGYPSDTID